MARLGLFLEFPKMLYHWPDNGQITALDEEEYGRLKGEGYKDSRYVKKAE